LIVLAISVSAVAQNKPAEHNFKGLYVGGYLGATAGRSDVSTSTVPSSYFDSSSAAAISVGGARKVDSSGFTGGGTFGYNWQWDKIVPGFETDFGAMALNDRTTSTGAYACCPGAGFTFNQRVQTDWIWTLRPRLGFTTHRAMIYGTGGMAVTNLTYSFDFADTFASGANASTRAETFHLGWTGGAGVEFSTSPHWRIKGEYLYASFGQLSGTSNNLSNGGAKFPDAVFTHTADLRTHHFRFGFSYRF
jgi:outer membrane immunogenic protein